MAPRRGAGGVLLNDGTGFTGEKRYKGSSGPMSGTQHVRADKGHRDKIMRLQRFLKAQGYNVKVTGVDDAVTRSAATNWRRGVGRRNPEGWNAKAKGGNVPNKTPAPAKPKPVAAAPAKRPAAAPAKGPAAPTTRAPAAAPASGVAGFGGSDAAGATRLGPKYAETMAGMQFDPAIRSAEQQAARQKVQAPQNMADINRWYRDVLVSQGKAAERDAAMVQAGVGAVGDVTGDIVSSLGGGANEGAGVVGAAGAEGAATLQAIGQAGAEYNSDIRPLLEAERAGVSAREMANQNRLAQEISQGIQGLQQQRGAAKTAAQFDATKYNNELAQQAWQNQLAVDQTVLGAQGMGLDLEAQRLRNKQTQMEITAMQQQLSQKHGGTPKWDQLEYGDKQRLFQTIVAGALPSGFARGNYKQTLSWLKKYAVQQGFNAPQLQAWLANAARAAVSKSKANRKK